jgi:hypothetical protein
LHSSHQAAFIDVHHGRDHSTSQRSAAMDRPFFENDENAAYFSGKWHLGGVEKLHARAADSAHRVDDAIE